MYTYAFTDLQKRDRQIDRERERGRDESSERTKDKINSSILKV